MSYVDPTYSELYDSDYYNFSENTLKLQKKLSELYLYNGDLVEFGVTKKIFTNPEKQQTEDYITGRFG